MTKVQAGRLLVVLSVVAIFVGALFWQATDDDEMPAEVVASTTTTTVVQALTTLPQEEPYASLAAVLPAELEGYRIDSGAKATGALDLEGAVSAESDTQAERALLETRHFQHGYGRAFTNGETDVYMVVYDFAGAEDASLYLADGFITLYGRGASTYDVTEVAGAKGFSEGTEADGQPAVVHGVAFAKADRFVLVFTRSASTSTPAQAKQLAFTLYARA